MTDDEFRRILADTRRIAVVGVSLKPERPSHRVTQWLVDMGYEVFPVNPGHAGRTVCGRPVAAGLGDLPRDIQMVDIFRSPEHVPAVVAEALDLFPALETVWMQIGAGHPEAAAMARGRGVAAVMDRCPVIEHARLFGAASAPR
ncbi:CoA-binding protein [Palleronia sediminis]|uniref:CoA-binding protein n=1 Tax=Palleronia sediminis TaxID=2547833 RepID=A0A4R6ALX6_9RHOB|nr:CoA-binding protein [Palleronia sediminis]TDL84274.1 CoA-binding protein [Palleronia sediminis]